MAKVTLNVCLPEGVTTKDVEKLLLFTYFGHAIAQDVLEKFDNEQLDVQGFEIKGDDES
jgi:hypothetical protein